MLYFFKRPSPLYQIRHGLLVQLNPLVFKLVHIIKKIDTWQQNHNLSLQDGFSLTLVLSILVLAYPQHKLLSFLSSC